MSKPHPMLILNKLLANLYFIVAINVTITALFFDHVADDKIDIGMSWFTMLMDQIIISAGWIIYVRNSRLMNEERNRAKRIEKLLERLLNV